MRRQTSNHNFLEWLQHKVSETTTSEEVLAHLRHTHWNSYPEIASVVFQTGHKNLALSVLDQEPEESKQVETLLKWTENTAAFIKALENGNPDLIYMVMLKLQDKMPIDKFTATIRNFPSAMVLYKKYCREFNKQNLYEIHLQENNFVAQAQTFLTQAVDEKMSEVGDSKTNVLDEKESLLVSATEAYKKSSDNFTATLCQEQLKLFKFQKELSQQHHLNFIGKTVHETCFLLLKSDVLKTAEDFQNEYKIPERRFWWLRIRSLAELGHWACLEKLSKNKKCPLGFEAFVDVCLENNNKQEALRYLPKVGKKSKIKYYIKTGCLEEAAKMAFTKKDLLTLMQVRRMCKPRTALAETVESMVTKLDNANCHKWHSFSL